MCLVQSGLLDAVKLYGGSLISGLWFDSLSLTASYPTSGSHHRRQGMMVVVALSMLEVGKGREHTCVHSGFPTTPAAAGYFLVWLYCGRCLSIICTLFQAECMHAWSQAIAARPVELEKEIWL